MRIRLICVGSRMPRWVEDGWQEYAKRLPPELPLELVEIPLHTRSKNADVARLIRQEGEAMLAKVQPGERIVTLEVQGRPWSTEQLAEQLALYMQSQLSEIRSWACRFLLRLLWSSVDCIA